MVSKATTFKSMDLTEPNCKDFVASNYRDFAAFVSKDLIALAFLLVLPYLVAFLLVLPYLVAFLLVLPCLVAFLLILPYLVAFLLVHSYLVAFLLVLPCLVAFLIFPYLAIMVFPFQDSSLVAPNEKIVVKVSVAAVEVIRMDSEATATETVSMG